MSTNAALPPQPNSTPLQPFAPSAIALLTLVGFGLRLVLLDRFPLREDEAIYGYWALHAWFEDPNFLTVWPDKPPLFLWLLGGTLRLFGNDAAGARLLNIGVSTLTIPVVAATARVLWGERAGVGAALAMALSPFAIAFAPTVFTDSMLIFWGSLALLQALRGRAGWAGVCLGAAIITKQPGLLYLPLIAGLLVLNRPRNVWRMGLTSLGGLLLVLVPVIYWDSLRWRVAPSPWDLGMQNYGGLAPVQFSQWPARLRAWLPLLWELTGSWIVWLWLGALALLGQLPARLQVVKMSSGSLHIDGRPARRLAAALPVWHTSSRRWGDIRPTQWQWILAWSGGVLLFYLAMDIPAWDRYLLPMAPIVALLIARLLGFGSPAPNPGGGSAGYARQPTDPLKVGGLGGLPMSSIRPLVDLCRHLQANFALREQSLVVLVTVGLLLPPAWHAAQGGRPIGGDHGEYAGYTEAIAWLESELGSHDGPTAVLYHQRLGWQHQFYLYAAQRAGRYDLRWFPSAVYLADNAAKTEARPLFYIAPQWETVRDLPAHLSRRGVTLETRFEAGKMTVYELTRPPTLFCAWCVSQPPEAQRSDN